MDSIGDYLLTFVNPDFGKPNESKNSVTYTEARAHFDQLTDTLLDFPEKRKFLTTLKESFIEVFLELEDAENKNNSKKKENTKENVLKFFINFF